MCATCRGQKWPTALFWSAMFNLGPSLLPLASVLWNAMHFLYILNFLHKNMSHCTYIQTSYFLSILHAVLMVRTSLSGRAHCSNNVLFYSVFCWMQRPFCFNLQLLLWPQIPSMLSYWVYTLKYQACAYGHIWGFSSCSICIDIFLCCFILYTKGTWTQITMYTSPVCVCSVPGIILYY